MKQITINLGKGVVLTAPIKMNMSYEEWQKMTNYINSLLDTHFLEQEKRR